MARQKYILDNNMNFTQFELPLFLAPENSDSKGHSRVGQPRSKVAQSTYRTTKQVVKLLELDSDYFLLKSRSHGSGYCNDRYIAVSAGRNKWKLYELRTI